MNEDIERLVRLETKLDVVLENQNFFRASFDKHDERIKNLENSRSHTIGYAAAIGTNRISSGEAAPADLNVARQLLKDNNITVVPQTEHPAQKLALVLPFEEKQQAHG
jgi:hypothetical protein